MNRRGFLIGAGASACLLGSPARAWSEEIKAAAGEGAVAKPAHRLWVMRESGEQFDSPLLFKLDAATETAHLLFSYLWRDVRDRNQAVWIDAKLLFFLSDLQAKIATLKGERRPIMLTSGYRTPERNSTIEGAAIHSMHIYGKAADIRVEGVSIADLISIIGDMDHQGGIGDYSRFVHVDTGNKRRWSA